MKLNRLILFSKQFLRMWRWLLVAMIAPCTNAAAQCSSPLYLHTNNIGYMVCTKDREKTKKTKKTWGVIEPYDLLAWIDHVQKGISFKRHTHTHTHLTWDDENASWIRVSNECRNMEKEQQQQQQQDESPRRKMNTTDDEHANAWRSQETETMTLELWRCAMAAERHTMQKESMKVKSGSSVVCFWGSLSLTLNFSVVICLVCARRTFRM